MDEREKPETPGGAWFTGPPGGRRDYCVRDPERLFGGQGLVFEAQLLREIPQIAVSLKQLSRITADRAAGLLQRDAVLRSLAHPGLARHIETFLGPGLFEDGDISNGDTVAELVYVAAEWVPGTPLAELIRTPEVPEALQIIAEVADAVAYLHDKGLTHRDLHPGNIVITPDGHAVVIDLGYTRPAVDHAITLMRGGVGFIPPERDRDPSIATIECDLFQMGALSVYLLIGDPQTRTPLAEIVLRLTARLQGQVPNPAASAQTIVAMLADEPTSRPHDLSAWAAAVTTIEADGGATLQRSPSRLEILKRPRYAATATMLSVAIFGGLWFAWGTLRHPAAVRCVSSSGVAAADLDEAGRSFLPAIAAEAVKRGGCTDGPVQRYGPMVIQAMGPIGHPGGAVVSRAPGTVLYLTQAQWGSYRQIGGKDGNEAPIAAGPPLAVDISPGISVVTLTHGLLIGASPDSPHFWIPPPEVPIWQREGGATGHLGLPTSNVYPRSGALEQDFETGYMSLAAGASSIQVTTVPDRAAGLPAPSHLGGRLISQSDGTAWFVDKAGVRHWIPDGTVWACHGDKANLAVADLTGYVVASLPVGSPASC